MHWRTILVAASVRTARIVGLVFELAPQQGDLKPLAELVDRGSLLLALRQNGMQFVDESFGEGAVTGDAVHDELNGSLLIPQDVNQAGGFDVRARTGDEILDEAMGDQSFRRTPVKVVESLQNPSLDAQAADKALGELLQTHWA
jgi:hypothetical protein